MSGSQVHFVQYLRQPFAAGVRYATSVWLRALRPTFLNVYFRQAGPPYLAYSSMLVKATATWQQFQFTGEADPVPGMLHIVAEQSATFWVDDAAVSLGAASVRPPLPAGPVPRSNFGVHLNHPETAWPNIGDAVGTVRIWDGDSSADGSIPPAQWSAVNPAGGVYNWAGLDRRVAIARAHRADITYTLGGNIPRWASARPNADSPYGIGQCGEPSSDAV